ncbi:MAG: hypothetical protein Q9219_007525 [cf. Caloplaca sp. 3 TL-2023]
MWLLDTKTLKLKDFSGWIPPYTILSHTWDDEQVSFQNINTDEAQNRPGFEKIRRSCALAQSQGHQYIWIDTCCIDKKSSAELSEAINSMFTWYTKATVCYVYISDFPSPRSAMIESRWFTRGWTLQELLAPKNVEFYDENWRYISQKVDLLDKISQVTQIDAMYLSGEKSIQRASVAARMSWASERKTTRIEDEAYCLMGIFDVNMPLLYGEGNKAFMRLQHEIARSSDDESLFAWFTRKVVSGPFAPDTRAFKNCQDVRRVKDARPPGGEDTEAWTITNRGLRLHVRCQEIKPNLLHGLHAFEKLWGRLPDLNRDYENAYLLLVLNCAHQGVRAKPFSIVLMHVRISQNHYVRLLPCETEIFQYLVLDGMNDKSNAESNTRTIFITDVASTWELPLSVVRPSPTLLETHNLTGWYTSSLGFIYFRETDGGHGLLWEIHLEGWSGYAVLKFERLRDGGPPVFAILKTNMHSDGVKIVSLVPVQCSTTLAEAQKSLSVQDLLPPESPEMSVSIDGRIGISLTKQADAHQWTKIIDYFLSIT